MKTTAKACQPAGPLPRPTRGLLDSPLSCHKGRTVAWHLCSTPSARHTPPNTFHTPCTHQPHTIHLPPHTTQTPSPCHSHAICRPPTYLLHVIHTQTTCYFHHLRCAIHTHLHARHPCTQPLLPNENQAPTWNPKDSPAPPGPQASRFGEDTLPLPHGPASPSPLQVQPSRVMTCRQIPQGFTFLKVFTLKW